MAEKRYTYVEEIEDIKELANRAGVNVSIFCNRNWKSHQAALIRMTVVHPRTEKIHKFSSFVYIPGGHFGSSRGVCLGRFSDALKRWKLIKD